MIAALPGGNPAGPGGVSLGGTAIAVSVTFLIQWALSEADFPPR